MKLVISGSRTINSRNVVNYIMERTEFTPTQIVCGEACGVDRLITQWANENRVPHMRVRAEWKKRGRVAGLHRNTVMISDADAVLAIWDGLSHSTCHAIAYACLRCKPLEVWSVANTRVTPTLCYRQ